MTLSILNDYSEVLSLITFFLGLSLGNRLAIGRDKRKEFNLASKPIRIFLIGGSFGNWPQEIELDSFRTNLNPISRKRFNRAWEEMRNAHKEAYVPDGAGGRKLVNKKIIDDAVLNCIKYTNPR